MPRYIGTFFRFYKQMPKYIGTCFRFYTQMQVEKKAFAYRIFSHFTQQCMSKIIRIFLNFFVEEYQFRSTILFMIFFDSVTLLLKWCQIFDSTPLNQFLDFNNFPWVCWFVGKNLSSFENSTTHITIMGI